MQITNDTKTPNADFFTASEATGAAIGGIAGSLIASAYSNNGIVSLSHANDPANYIKKNLGEVLKSRHNLKVINGAENIISDKDQHKTSYLLSNYKDGDLILDANSVVIGSYYPFRFDRFRVFYYAFVKIIDRKTTAVIFKSTCKYNNKENNDNTLKEIAEDPKVISTIFESAQKLCLDKFKKEILE